MAVIADIVEIAAPASAEAGDTVLVDVKVKNLGGGYIYNYIGLTGAYDSSAIQFQFDYLSVQPGETVTFRGWFTMPAQNVTVTVYSFFWNGSGWVQDDTAQAKVDLSTALPVFSGFEIDDYLKV